MTTATHPAAGAAIDAVSDAVGPADAPVLFDAVLRPNRSLGPRGFVILMLTLGGLSFAAGLAFMAVGAWPVFGFLGLDVLAVYVAFRLNYRAGRRYEALRLTEQRLSLLRVDWRGQRQRQEFQPYWLRVELDEPVTPGSQIMLASHGRRSIVGSFLSPTERAEFAAALRQALADLRR
jgi:uncharacterized membrane protein